MKQVEGKINMSAQPLIHPFTRHMTVKKIRFAEDGWASRSSEKVSLGYTSDSKRRNRVEFFTVRSESLLSFEPKWSRELHCHVIAELRSFMKNSIAAHLACESRDGSGNWLVVMVAKQGIRRARPLAVETDLHQ